MDDVDLNQLKTREGAQKLRTQLYAQKMVLAEKLRMVESMIAACDAVSPQPRYSDARD